MEHYGSDFNATGSVMSRAELEDQRRKRGECVRCGQKCFQKKLFKMIPITEHGKVENGRCLNCNPLDGSAGTIPAVSRPATQADLKRFSRSQTVMRSQSSHNNAGRGPATSNGGIERRSASQHMITDGAAPSSRRQYSSGARRPSPSPSNSGTTQSMRSLPNPTVRSGNRSDCSVGSVDRDQYIRGDRSTDGEGSVISSCSSTRGALGAHITGRSSDSIQSEPAIEISSPHDNRGMDTGIMPPNGTARPGFSRPNSSRSISASSYYSEVSAGQAPRRVQSDDEVPDADYERMYGYHESHNGGFVRGGDTGRYYSGSSPDRDFAEEGTERAPPRNVDYYQRSPRDIKPINHLDGSRHDSNMNGVSDDALRASSSHHKKRGSLSSYHDSLAISNHNSYHLHSSYMPTESTSSGSTRVNVMVHGDMNASMDFRRQAQRKNSLDHSVASFEDESRPRIGRQNSLDEYSSSGLRFNESSEDLALPPSADLPILERLRELSNDYVEILNVMRDYKKFPTVQNLGLQMLSNLQLTEEDCNALAELGAIQTITEVMFEFGLILDIQIAGCRAMWNASFTPTNQVAFVEFGALDILLQSMTNFINSPDLQEQAISVLSNIGACEQNLVVMFEKGAIKKIVEAMNMYLNRTTVQIRGCLAIANLASHHSSLKKQILETGAGSAIVIAMVIHPINPELQEKALRALRNLSANCDENRIELTNIGGIDAVVSAMQVHRDSAGVQEAGAWTLSNLAGNPDSRVLIGDCGGIDVTIRAMWVHSDKVTVQEWCCRALFTLSLEQHNNSLIMEVGGISAVVNAMQAHTDLAAFQEIGCAVLYNLAFDNPSKIRIVDEEALDAVVLAMVLHSDDDKVQERACQLLLQLSISENLKAMQASNVGELVKAAAIKFPQGCSEFAGKLMHVMDEYIATYQTKS